MPIPEDLRKIMVEKKDYVTVKVKVEKSDYFYKKEGLNIYSKFDIGPMTAMNGGTVLIPGLWGLDLKLDIPAGTSSHQMLTLPGEGIKISESLEGDHHVEIGINMDLLTKRDKNFLKRSAAEDTTSTENEEDDVIEPVIVKRDFLSENKNSNS